MVRRGGTAINSTQNSRRLADLCWPQTSCLAYRTLCSDGDVMRCGQSLLGRSQKPDDSDPISLLSK